MESKETPFISAQELGVKTALGTVFENVTFDAGRGRTCVFFGEQGSGKTSLMLTLSGRMKYTSGMVSVDGLDLKKCFRKMRQESNISFIPRLNEVQPYLKVKDITAAEIALSGRRGNKKNTDAFLKEWHFFEKKDVRFKDLDSYDAARFGILLALASSPQLLVVDDIQSEITQYKSIRLMKGLTSLAHEKGITVLVGCSEYAIARYADGVVVMTQDAEEQRQAVIRHQGPDAAIPVLGTASGVVAASHVNMAADTPTASSGTGLPNPQRTDTKEVAR